MKIFDSEKDVQLAYNLVEIVQHLEWWTNNLKNKVFQIKDLVYEKSTLIFHQEMINVEVTFENGVKFEIIINPSNFEASINHNGAWTSLDLSNKSYQGNVYFCSINYQENLNEALEAIYDSAKK